jgi:hypothetical protein
MQASRITLLILMSGAFAAVWSGDHPDEPTNAARFLSHIDHQNATGTLIKLRCDSCVSPPALSHQNQKRFSSVPLLPTITAGTYLVSDCHGRTEIRTVSLLESSNTEHVGKFVKTDHYVVRRGNLRLHFIRIDEVLRPAKRQQPRVE